MARNWLVVSLAMEAVAGLTASDCRAAVFTVTPTVEVIEPLEAYTRVVPVSAPDSRPVELILATAGFEVVQLTDVVKSCALPSWKIPVAVSCSFVPAAKEGVAGVTEIEIRGAVKTVKVAEAWTEPLLAVMVALPG